MNWSRYSPNQQVREVKAYEYLCSYCVEPLTDPEFGNAFVLVGLDDDGQPKRITDYGDQGEVYELVEGYPEHSPGRVDTALDMVVHPYAPTGKTPCWHWCMYEEVQRIGPAEECPLKDQHEDTGEEQTTD